MTKCRTCESHLMPDRSMCLKCGDWTPNNEESSKLSGVDETKMTTLDQVDAVEIDRIVTGGPWDPVWGGGFVPGSESLVGGTAGAGKTSILLQIGSAIARITNKIAYFLSGEMAPNEIRLMANRLQIDNLHMFSITREFGAGAVINEDVFKKYPPSSVTVDSVSAFCGKDNHEATILIRNYKKIAVKQKIPVFLISHMNKEGDFGGLYTAQHDVDTIVTVFGSQSDRDESELRHLGHTEDTITNLRILTPWKNRFGPSLKDYRLMMTKTGLVALPELEEKRSRGSRRKSTVTVPAQLMPAVEGVSLPSRKDPFKGSTPDAILMPNGQKLVRKTDRTVRKPHKATELLNMPLKATVKEISSRAKAVEGEALKRKRAPMTKTGWPKVSGAKLWAGKSERAAKSSKPKPGTKTKGTRA